MSRRWFVAVAMVTAIGCGEKPREEKQAHPDPKVGPDPKVVAALQELIRPKPPLPIDVEPGKPTPPQPKPPEPKLSVVVDSLIGAYVDNPVRADQKYRGRIEVVGRVGSIDERGFNLVGLWYGGITPFPVAVELGQDKAILTELHRSDDVLVSGDFKGKNLGVLQIDDASARVLRDDEDLPGEIVGKLEDLGDTEREEVKKTQGITGYSIGIDRLFIPIDRFAQDVQADPAAAAKRYNEQKVWLQGKVSFTRPTASSMGLQIDAKMNVSVSATLMGGTKETLKFERNDSVYVVGTAQIEDKSVRIRGANVLMRRRAR